MYVLSALRLAFERSFMWLTFLSFPILDFYLTDLTRAVISYEIY